MLTITDLKQLYEIDDSQWLEETVEILKNRQFKDLDLENLIEELEDLGREKKISLEREVIPKRRSLKTYLSSQKVKISIYLTFILDLYQKI